MALIAIALIAISAAAKDISYAAGYLLIPSSPCSDALQGTDLASLNPAHYAFYDGWGFGITQAFHIAGENQNNLSLRWGNQKLFAGLSAYIASENEIEGRTHPTEEPEYLFGAHQAVFTASLGWSPKKAFAIAAAAKRISEKIELNEMNATAFDIGAIVQPSDNITVQIAASNVGDKVRYKDVLYSLPLMYSAGLWLKYPILSGGISVQKPDITPIRATIAAERNLTDWLFIRAGLIYGQDSRLFSAGASFRYDGWEFSYSFVPYRNGLGIRHSIGLEYHSL